MPKGYITGIDAGLNKNARLDAGPVPLDAVAVAVPGPGLGEVLPPSLYIVIPPPLAEAVDPVYPVRSPRTSLQRVQEVQLHPI